MPDSFEATVNLASYLSLRHGENEINIDELNFHGTENLNQYKTKCFLVKPRQRLSLQSHKHRHELWTIVSGNGVCTVDDKVFEVANDSFVMVPKGARHRIENVSETTDLIIAEVQVGDYLSESDIVRYEDDYGRGK